MFKKLNCAGNWPSSKAASKPYRKMGHVTVLDRDIAEARRKAERVRKLLEITGEDHP